MKRSREELEVRLRIFLSVCAFSYEYMHDSLIEDLLYDALSSKVNLSIKTTNPVMDKWFKKNFNPSTGMWIVKKHPKLWRIDILYNKYYKGTANAPIVAQSIYDSLVEGELGNVKEH